MDRYLVQFREHACDYFVTDCAFREGQIHRAILYVTTVVDTLDYVAEGQVLDAETKTCVYQYAGDGIDDDPFVQYRGPDDPAIRYS